MKKYLLFILFISLYYWSCSNQGKDNRNQINVEEISEYDIKKLIQIDDSPLFHYESTNKPADGKIFQLLNNGQKVILGNLKRGKPDGLWTKWHDNGNKIEEGNYKNGQLEGYFSLYHLNGSKSLEGSILHGKKNGLFAMYHENGIRSFRGEYFNGSGKGTWIYYNKDGEVIRKKDCDSEECI